VLSPEAYAYHEAWLRSRPQDYGDDVRERLRVGAFVSGSDYLKGQRVRGLLRDELNAAFAQADVLVCATTPIVATPVGQTEVTVEHARMAVRTSLIRYTRPFNLTGHPVASVPCGFTAAGLPVGLQIVGRAFDEATVLRVADAYQRATDWHKRRPPLDVPAAPAA
jgi:aspartyl-tRNA(Asn)/glutamyl-tRNA(Gln) amidotransferase subunit A